MNIYKIIIFSLILFYSLFRIFTLIREKKKENRELIRLYFLLALLFFALTLDKIERLF
jgi:hypothetical protein